MLAGTAHAVNVTVPQSTGYGQVLIGNAAGGSYTPVATSTLGVLTSDVIEGTKLFFTNARAIAATLTGFSATTGTVSSSDSILVAIEKLAGNAATYITNATGLITNGTGIGLSGSGTSGSPYSISNTGVTSIVAGANVTISGSTGAVTVNSTGGGSTGLATSSPISASNLLVYSSVGAGSAYGVATSTLTASSPLTGSFTQVGSGGSLGCQVASGSQAGCLSSTDWNTFNGKGSGSVTSIATNNGITGGTITTTGTIGLATINAGVLGAVTNGAVPTSQATSTLYGLGTNGFVLAEVAGIPTWVATTTLSTISGSLNLASQVTGILPIANGGTATSTGGVTNGVEFYNGSTLTNNAGLTYSGTLLGVGTTSPAGVLSVFETPTNANLNAFIIGSSTSAFATTTLFTVSNTGVTTLSSGSAGKASLTFSGLSNSYGFYEADSSHIGITDSGTAGPQLALGASSGFSLASTNGVYWTTSGTAIGTVDVGFRRLSANTLSLLTSSTNAGSFTPAGTFLAGTIGAGGTTTPFGLLASAGAAGGTSNLFVVSSSTSAFATTTVVQIDQNGNLLAGFNGAKVGINTTAPTQPLTIAGLTTGQSAELTPSTNFNGLFGLRLDNSSATEIAGFKANPSTGEIRLSTGSTYFPTFYSNGIEAARITTTGLTGFGTTTPFALFEIASSSNSSTFKSQLVLTDTNAGANLKHWAFTSAAGALTIGTTSDLYATSTALSISANGIVQIKELAAAAGTFIAADPNGNLIATTTPGGSFTNTLANGGTATTTFYSGGVVFSDGAKLTQAPSLSNWSWDNTNFRMGFGTSTPNGILSFLSTPTASTTVYSTAGTYTYNPFPGTQSATLTLWGGGGGGGSCSSTACGSGGGAAAYVASTTVNHLPGAVTLIVGQGGRGATNGTTPGVGGTGFAAGAAGVTSGGGGGGSSAFGNTIIASGGGGGVDTAAGTGATGKSGGTGGTGTGTGGGGGSRTAGAAAVAGTGGTTQTGTNGSGGTGGTFGNGGGSSAGFTGNGNSAVGATAGLGSGGATAGANGTGQDSGGGGSQGAAGGSPGGGGGGIQSGSAGGNGGDGKVIVTAMIQPLTVNPIDVGDLTVITPDGSIGIGTTTPTGRLSIVSNNAISIFITQVIGSTSYITEELDALGNYVTSGPPPIANSCAGFAISGAANNRNGTITMTTTGTCSISFGATWPVTPSCFITPMTSNTTWSVQTISTTGFTVTFGTNQAKFAYLCQGAQ